MIVYVYNMLSDDVRCHYYVAINRCQHTSRFTKMMRRCYPCATRGVIITLLRALPLRMKRRALRERERYVTAGDVMLRRCRYVVVDDARCLPRYERGDICARYERALYMMSGL